MSETINIEKMKSVSSKSDATVVNENGITVHTTEYEHSENLSNTGTQIFSGNDITGYVIKQSHPGRQYIIYKEFYKNGILRVKGETFKQGNFKSGVWYWFDSTGKLVKETNYDSGYVFTINDVLKVLEDNKIKLNDKDTKITRAENTNSPVWNVQWRKDPVQKEMIKIDGVTGKILERISYNHPDK